MSNKKLKPATIIPSHLYVERAADRQVRSILEDMGRPGYVLVARQMGKTNLLLHARRSFAESSDIFVYLDVSNIFPDIEGFFRNIIDVALDSYCGAVETLRSEIYAARKRGSRLAHKEHEAELRLVLRHIPGRLVICLDEIDALTKTTYSDQAFSLIRSNYFSGRANFPEFERLTYLLSGVAEPADIIKNKEISPFNIGEKIYLEDFSRSEFAEFLNKTGLSFDARICEEIYFWTSGNPRMTWDLCSAVEDEMLGAQNSRAVDVEGIVRKMYLTSFDLPPIDHIRKLVEEDKDIRNALMSLHYDRSSSISDPIRNRLYLAGICRIDVATRDVLLKNKIVALALSEDWIRQIDKDKLSIEKLAQQYFEADDYVEAVRAYTQVINQTSDNVDKTFFYYYLGVSLYRINDFDGAIKYLSLQPIKSTVSSVAYLNSRFILGLANFFAGHYAEAAEILDEVVAKMDPVEQPYDYCQAKVSFGSALFNSDAKNAAAAVEVWKSVIDIARVQAPKSSDKWDSLVALTKSNMAQGLSTLGQDEDAKTVLLEAIDSSAPYAKPERYLQLAKLLRPNANYTEPLTAASECVTKFDLIVTPNVDQARRFNQRVLRSLILELHQAGLNNSLFDLLKHVVNKFSQHEVDGHDLIERIVHDLIGAKAFEPLFHLLHEITVDGMGNVDEFTRKMALAFIIVLPEKTGIAVEPEFCALVESDSYRPSAFDVGAFFTLIMVHLNTKDLERAEYLVALTEKLRLGVDMSSGAMLILDYLHAVVQLQVTPGVESREYALSVIKAARETRDIQVPFFNVSFAEVIVRTLRLDLRKSMRPQQVVRVEKKVGRNEIVKVRYADGVELTGKYKGFQTDISNGLCTIV